MLKRFSVLTIAGMILIFSLAFPASAENENWAVGAGYWNLPNLSVEDVGSSGIFASVQMKSSNYLVEFDYSLQDPTFYALAGDYLYPISGEETGFGGSGYIGAGYTYFSCDDLSNESGFNILAGADFGNSLFGSVRYDMLGSDSELLTIGITYSFQ
jgi:hypothetical protein